MPLPIIPTVSRATLIFNSAVAPRPATINLHFRDIPGGQTEANLYADLDTNVTQAMWTTVGGTAAINNVTVIKLDGASAGQTFLTPVATRWQGLGSADCILQGATCISLKSTLRGPRGRNRVYLPWVGEGQQVNGVLDNTAVGNTTAAWNAFRAAMIVSGWQMQVVSPANIDSEDVSSLVVRNFVKTQRRRARR